MLDLGTLVIMGIVVLVVVGVLLFKRWCLKKEREELSRSTAFLRHRQEMARGGRESCLAANVVLDREPKE